MSSSKIDYKYNLQNTSSMFATENNAKLPNNMHLQNIAQKIGVLSQKVEKMRAFSPNAHNDSALKVLRDCQDAFRTAISSHALGKVTKIAEKKAEPAVVSMPFK